VREQLAEIKLNMENKSIGNRCLGARKLLFQKCDRSLFRKAVDSLEIDFGNVQRCKKRKKKLLTANSELNNATKEMKRKEMTEEKMLLVGVLL